MLQGKAAQEMIGRLSSNISDDTLSRAMAVSNLLSNDEETELNIILSDKEKLNAIIQSARAILEKKSFPEAARAIFDQCCRITGAISGYVALLSEDGHENEVLFLESGGMPCSVDPELPMPIRGLRSVAYETHKVVYDNDFMKNQWVTYLPSGHIALENVMFVPLNIDEKTVGIMGLANKPSEFTDADAEMASVFGELAAISLTNSRYLEKHKELEENLRLMANTDNLTKLANRRSFENHFRWALKNSQRNSEWLSIIIIDIDHFKKINDSYGHQAGDSALIDVGSAIKQACRENDYPARWGGEEFIVLLHGADADQSLLAAERIRAHIAKVNVVDQNITASVGVSTLLPSMTDGPMKTLDQLVSAADKALYAAKSSGRNRVVHVMHPNS